MVLAGNLAGTITSHYGLPLVMGIILFELVFITFMIYNRWIWWWYIFLPIFTFFSFFFMQAANRPFLVESCQFITVEGQVNKVVKKEGYNQLFLYGNEGKGIIVNDKSQCNVITGDTIRAAGEFSLYNLPRNKGSSNLWLYYKTLNIEGGIWVEDIIVVKENTNPIYTVIFSIRDRLSDSFDKICTGNDGGILKSIILGDKSDLEEDIKKLYQVNGIAHILAISGLHVSIIGMGVYKCLRKLSLSFFTSFVIGMLLVLSYGIMTGNGISTIRAVTMLIMCMFADVAGEAYDLVSGMCLSAIILILKYPMIIYNSGFLLSFGAVFGISVVNGKVTGLLNLQKRSLKNSIIKTLIASASVSLTTLPIILYTYYEVPIYSIFLNIIVVPLAAYLMVSGLLGGIIGMFFVPLGALCAGTAHFVLLIYEKMCEFVGNIPNSVIIPGQPKLYVIWIFYILIGIFIMGVNIRKSKMWLVILLSALVLLVVRIDGNDFTMEIIDVGQGDGIFIRSCGTNMLIDGGSTSEKKVYEYVLEPFLKSQGVSKLDYVVITHGDMDHTSGIVELINNGTIKLDYLVVSTLMAESDSKVVEAARTAKIKVVAISAKDRFSCGNISFTCLHPDSNYVTDSENDKSVVLKGECGDFTMLFTGDIEDKGENTMISNKLLSSVDFLKVAHHGSMYSTDNEFLNIVKPKLATISCASGNSYGHPHKELLQRLENITDKIYITRDTGMITVTKKGEAIEVDTFLIP